MKLKDYIIPVIVLLTVGCQRIKDATSQKTLQVIASEECVEKKSNGYEIFGQEQVMYIKDSVMGELHQVFFGGVSKGAYTISTCNPSGGDYKTTGTLLSGNGKFDKLQIQRTFTVDKSYERGTKVIEKNVILPDDIGKEIEVDSFHSFTPTGIGFDKKNKTATIRVIFRHQFSGYSKTEYLDILTGKTIEEFKALIKEKFQNISDFKDEEEISRLSEKFYHEVYNGYPKIEEYILQKN